MILDLEELRGLVKARVEKRAITNLATLNKAYDYPKPSSFSRGMRIDLNGLAILLISGTASIDESGQSVHIGIFAPNSGEPSRTSAGCSMPKALPGMTSSGPLATCAISSGITKRSTRSGRRFIESRGWIRCRHRPGFRQSFAGLSYSSRSKRSRCLKRNERLWPQMSGSLRPICTATAFSRPASLLSSPLSALPCALLFVPRELADVLLEPPSSAEVAHMPAVQFVAAAAPSSGEAVRRPAARSAAAAAVAVVAVPPSAEAARRRADHSVAVVAVAVAAAHPPAVPSAASDRWACLSAAGPESPSAAIPGPDAPWDCAPASPAGSAPLAPAPADVPDWPPGPAAWPRTRPAEEVENAAPPPYAPRNAPEAPRLLRPAHYPSRSPAAAQ